MKLPQFLTNATQEASLKKVKGVKTFAVFLISYLALSANAAHLGVYPLGLELDVKQNRGIITVTNSGRECVSIQAETLAWLQENHEQYYFSSNSILVEPQIFTILPGKSQELMLKNTFSADIDQETAYRLLLTEMPNAASPCVNRFESEPKGLTTLLQFSLPIYIKPLTNIKIQQWRAYYNEKGNILLELNNKGNVHIRVNHIFLYEDMDTVSHRLKPKNLVIFPQKTEIWEFKPKSNNLIKTIRLEIKTDEGVQTRILAVNGI